MTRQRKVGTRVSARAATQAAAAAIADARSVDWASVRGLRRTRRGRHVVHALRVIACVAQQARTRRAAMPRARALLTPAASLWRCGACPLLVQARSAGRQLDGDTCRVHLRIADRHYLVLVHADQSASIREADRHAESGAWWPLVISCCWERAVVEWSEQQGYPVAVLHAVMRGLIGPEANRV